MRDGHGLSPVVQRRRLRAELRGARQEAGLTQWAVAEAMEWSLSKVIRIEAGSVGISRNDLRALLHLYRIVDPDRTDELLALARAARERAWWSKYRDVAPPELLQLIGYETAASAIRRFETLLVPGLLQTEEYARTLIVEFEEQASTRRVSTLIEIRMRRQELLEKVDPPLLIAILDEAVVRRSIGGKAVMRRQVHRLIEMASRPNVTVEIVPFSAGAHPGLRGSFTVLEFPDLADDNVLYLESGQGDLINRSGPEEALTYQQKFERLQEISLGAENSIACLERISLEIT
jgi:hypothetical protein